MQSMMAEKSTTA